MAENKKSILVYADWIDKFEELTDEEAGKLIKHFFRYVNDLNPEAPDRTTKLMFIDIKNTLKRDLNKWEDVKNDRSDAGLKSAFNKFKEKIDNLDKIDFMKEFDALNKGNGKEEYKKLCLNYLSTVQQNSTSVESVEKNPTKPTVSDSVSVSVSVNIYKEADFLKNWSKCRMHFMKQVTHIKKLERSEKDDFDKAIKEFTKEEINTALHGLFKQENKNISSMYTKPKHFLSNISKYLNAELNKDYALYGKDQSKSKKGGL